METPHPAPFSPPADSEPPASLWQPLNRIQRRVLGVLVEKAKTTPSTYPLSLNAIVTGCNQKSNRDPQMELDSDDVEEALDQLRELKAVGEVHGDGRVIKYRHYLKDWLGVDGTELAVMAELLLRGTQTVGELRARAARMAAAQLPDLTALRPVLDTLIQKRLVVMLSPAGRGQIVTHGLYQPDEMEKVRTRAARDAPSESSHAPAAAAAPLPPRGAAPESQPSRAALPVMALEAVQAELRGLREEIGRMKKEIEDIWANLSE